MDKPLTILHTIQTGGPGGAETLVLQIASGLNPDCYRSVVLLPGGRWLPARLDERGIPYVLADSHAWYDTTVVRRMVEVVRRENVDVIHSHLPGQNFYACLAGKITGKPVIVTYHGAVELEQSRGFKGKTRLWVVRNFASAFAVVCDQMARALGDAGFPDKKIIRIYNGVEVDRFTPGPSGILRSELGLAPDTPIVGMVANIRPPKGYEYFVRAARIVLDRFPHAYFVSVGEGKKGLSEKLDALVDELHLRNRFSFLGLRSDVPELLRDFDVFALSSISEGFPFVALEAMSAGKPSVMTRCGGPEEIVDDGVTGFLVSIADPSALAEKISLLLSDPVLAAGMGRAARAKILAKFTLPGMLRNYERFYRRLHEGGSRALQEGLGVASEHGATPHV